MAPPSRYSTPVSVRLPSPKRKPTSRSGGTHHEAHSSPRSPSRDEENRIRRGAEIIRRQIQQQLLHMESLQDTESPHSRVTPRHTERRQEFNRPWKEEYAWKAPSVRKGDLPTTTIDHSILLTDSSRGSSATTLEEKLDAVVVEDTSSVGDFSDPWRKAGMKAPVDDPTEPYESSSSSNGYHTTRRGFVPVETSDSPVRAAPRSTEPIRTREDLNEIPSRKPTEATQQVVCFLSSDDDDDDDIMEVKEPMFDAFYEQDLLPVEANVKVFEQHALSSPISRRSTRSLHREGVPTPSEEIFTYQEGRQAVVVVPPDRPASPVDGNSSSSSSGPTYPQLQNLDHIVEQTEAMEVSYRLPRHLESPEKETGARKLPVLGYEDEQIVNFDDNDAFESPGKEQRPMSEVPVRSPSNVSLLSTPEKTSPKRIQDSVFWENYDKLLRDPAYRHAQSAGFVWQSIVGQHVHFPSHWWNGLRGPPIGEEGLPWIYFGRHTVPQNRVLNQLVKGRASGGRLLLHIVVQDLLTRTPVQDIAIGCFHPNAKGIRLGEQALKRLEDCRDVWMSIRKRSRQSVSATDSLLYSQSNWDGNHSMCRSPLGPGQRVTNTNVRSVFGDKAPLETIFLSEDELYERLNSRIKQATVDGAVSPPMAILQEFVFA